MRRLSPRAFREFLRNIGAVQRDAETLGVLWRRLAALEAEEGVVHLGDAFRHVRRAEPVAVVLVRSSAPSSWGARGYVVAPEAERTAQTAAAPWKGLEDGLVRVVGGAGWPISALLVRAIFEPEETPDDLGHLLLKGVAVGGVPNPRRQVSRTVERAAERLGYVATTVPARGAPKVYRPASWTETEAIAWHRRLVETPLEVLGELVERLRERGVRAPSSGVVKVGESVHAVLRRVEVA